MQFLLPFFLLLTTFFLKLKFYLATKKLYLYIIKKRSTLSVHFLFFYFHIIYLSIVKILVKYIYQLSLWFKVEFKKTIPFPNCTTTHTHNRIDNNWINRKEEHCVLKFMFGCKMHFRKKKKSETSNKRKRSLLENSYWSSKVTCRNVVMYAVRHFWFFSLEHTHIFFLFDFISFIFKRKCQIKCYGESPT